MSWNGRNWNDWKTINRKRIKRTALLAFSLAAGLTAAAIAGNAEGRQAAVQQEISAQVVRFHVLANSDRVEDQERKREVRDRLLGEMAALLENADTREETEHILKEHTGTLEQAAEECLRENGSQDEVRVVYTEDYFPVKSYGDYTLPAGNYEALRVEIGRARGHNWWCMLYPSLCFFDAVHPVLDEEEGEKLEQVLSDEAYHSIYKKGPVHFTFKWF